LSAGLQGRFDAQGREWRDPAQVVAQWSDAGAADPELLRVKARGDWWDVLAAAGVTLIVSREYEHLVLALAAGERPRLSYMRLPHPSGIAFDAAGNALYVASTRNPNQIYAFAPVSGARERRDTPGGTPALRRLVPTRSLYLPGCYYLHDLALVGGRLHANSVGQNTIVEIGSAGARAVWWPASVDRAGAPRSDRNYLQLNSIAAGDDLRSSFFSASGERPGRYRPGDAAYPVDRRGVIYSGATREPVVRGLTRPHSARLHAGRLWVDDSGYGEVGFGEDGAFVRVCRLPGWTRGLAFAGGVAFVGTSRVIPRFRQYAPGLDVERSVCAIHAIEVSTGRVLGSLEFPAGNQIFAIEPVPTAWTAGFPFHTGANAAAVRRTFYAYTTGTGTALTKPPH
jgi:uncharacterized protein (TIGR03032 family)